MPWKVLFDGAFAARVRNAQARALPAGTSEPAAKPVPAIVEAERERDVSPALQLLAMLQREGRLIDFLEEDTSSFSDAEIGAAARVVHAGCKRALAEYVQFAPVRSESEGAPVVLEPGYDAARVRVTGNVVGDPPFRGKLAHHGWSVTKIHLPELSPGRDPKIVAAAEVEI